nr:MAG TPA: antitoxin [Caudoviricetes sp.]
MKKYRKQVSLSIPAKVKAILDSIATHEHRPISMQLELMAEQECRRLGIPVPQEQKQD